MQNQSALQLLNDIREQAIGLAEQDITYSTQSAGVKNIAYVVNGINFFSNAKDIKEISVCENLTSIPQTKPWLRGLINSKGVLYSVTDLSLFAGYNRPTASKKGHLLLLKDDHSQSALLVNKVIGFRYFDDSMIVHDLDENIDFPEGLSAYLDSGRRFEDQIWYELDVTRLLASEQFREVQ